MGASGHRDQERRGGPVDARTASKKWTGIDFSLDTIREIQARQGRQQRARLRRDLLRAADRFDLLDPEAAAVARWLAEEAGA